MGLAALAALIIPAHASDVAWTKDAATAFATAKKSHKLVMVDFYTDWCVWCKRLDAGAYKDPKVVALTGQLVPLKSDAEKEGKDMAKKYGVNGYPTILFLNADGTLVSKLVGYQPAPDFANTVALSIELPKEYGALKSKLSKSPNDGEGNAKMALFASLKDAKASTLSGYVDKALASGYRGPYLAKALDALGDAYQAANQPDKMLECYQKAVKFAIEPGDKSTALVNLMFAQMQKDKDGAKATAHQLIALQDATPEWVTIAQSLVKQMDGTATH
jgi:thiol-disulfide isomerase/thioredoxin